MVMAFSLFIFLMHFGQFTSVATLLQPLPRYPGSLPQRALPNQSPFGLLPSTACTIIATANLFYLTFYNFVFVFTLQFHSD